MDRARALKVLNLDERSDSHEVETSYWTLVRHAQTRSPDEVTAAKEVDRLNAAYAALTPKATPMAMAEKPPAPATKLRAVQPAAPGAQASHDNVIDAVIDWLGAEAARVQRRWSGRNAEIALIAGAALALAVVALSAGTSVLLVLACLAAVAIGVWSPWRNDPPGA